MREPLMSKLDLPALQAAFDALPAAYAGPGGVAGILIDGEIFAMNSWGYADLDARLPMTEATRLPICSITKQFTCMALLAELPDPEILSGRLAEALPLWEGPLPRIAELCHNQSGLRDYWALTVLCGAKAEQVFRREDLTPMLAQMRGGHFAPGMRYSYSNLNYRLLADLLEAETGKPLEALCRRHIWEPEPERMNSLEQDPDIDSNDGDSSDQESPDPALADAALEDHDHLLYKPQALQPSRSSQQSRPSLSKRAHLVLDM